MISTVAGNGTLGDTGDGGPALNAGIGPPIDMAIDSAGNLYIAGNNVIRKVDTTGKISTFAGNGTAGSSGDGGPATSAALFGPVAVAVDGAGNVYIADAGEGLRKVNTSGIINSVPVISSFLSKIASPGGLTVDSAGNVYISDLNGSAIYKLDKAGVLTTVAGGTLGFSGDGGPATKAALSFPSGVAMDSAGNIYFADKGNNRVRKVDTKGVITTVAGSSGPPGFTGDGGPATSAKLGFNTTFPLQGVAVDSAGNLYIADPQNNRIRMVNTAGIISTYAGGGSIFQTAHGDGGPPAKAGLSTPNGVHVDSAGNIFIADTGEAIVRKVAGGAAGAGGGSAPVISANGVVNGASFQPGIVANSWVTIQGAGLAPKTDDWSSSIVNGRLPISLDGVSVSMGGVPAYIAFISPTQLNVLAPNLAPGPVSVTITTPGGTSPAVTVTVRQYAPAFFLWPGSQPVATRQDFSLAVKNGTFAGANTVPAKPGDIIILWGTGFGPTSPSPPSGFAVPGDQAYATSTMPTVTINNTSATVFGAALAPGAAGLYQVAIQVPATLADGDWPIQALIGGVLSPAGTILSVHH